MRDRFLNFGTHITQGSDAATMVKAIRPLRQSDAQPTAIARPKWGEAAISIGARHACWN